MAYLVLALGALLSVGGALSIFQGAGIVQVERGWTGVIAGATSLTGGIITIALGLILRALLDLRARNDRRIADAGTVVAADPVGALIPSPATPVAAPAPALSARASDFDDGLLAAFLEAKPDVPADTANLTPPPVQEEPTPVLTLPEPRSRPLPPTQEREQPEPAKTPAKVAFRTTVAPPAAAPPAAAPAPLPEDHPPAPAMDDWLDRAFSSLDNEVLGGAGETRGPAPHNAVAAASLAEWAASDLPDASRDHHAVAELEPDHPAPQAMHEPEPVHAPASAATPPPVATLAPVATPKPETQPLPEAAVIGRYEADGTSYIMFSDGSIEAQSEAGVYRFSSMTELKAFIEGTS